jgi:hypothetical protein
MALESKPNFLQGSHSDVVVRGGAHRPMEHIQGFTRSHHWMPPSVKCLRRIASVAAMVNKFVETKQNKALTKHNF